MYKNIIAAVSGSAGSEAAARYAVALAEACGSEIAFVFAAGHGTPVEELRHAEASLERLFLLAEGRGLKAESVVETGEPVEGLKRLVAGRSADILFASTGREDMRRRLLIKTLARRILEEVPCAAALVRMVHMSVTRPGGIIAALGGKGPAAGERALFTAMLAKAYGARVTLLHLAEPAERLFRGEVRLMPEERHERMPADMRAFAEALEARGVAFECRVASGGLKGMLASEAAIRKGDLVILGAGGRGALHRAIKGDPLGEVLRETPYNLIVYRPGKGRG